MLVVLAGLLAVWGGSALVSVHSVEGLKWVVCEVAERSQSGVSWKGGAPLPGRTAGYGRALL